MSGATIFSTIDLKVSHRIRTRLGDESGDFFKAKDGLHEWMIMPFFLEMHLAHSRVRTQVLHPFIGKLLIIYFDDILIYFNTKEHLMKVRGILRVEKFYANLKKCSFMTNMVFVSLCRFHCFRRKNVHRPRKGHSSCAMP